MAVRERQLIAETDRILAGLEAEIDALVCDVQQTSSTRKADSDQTASTGSIVMLIVGIVGVIVVILGAGVAMFRRQAASAGYTSKEPWLLRMGLSRASLGEGRRKGPVHVPEH